MRNNPLEEAFQLTERTLPDVLELTRKQLRLALGRATAKITKLRKERSFMRHVKPISDVRYQVKLFRAFFYETPLKFAPFTIDPL